MSTSAQPSQILLVGQKIRLLRKSRRLTQASLAAQIGVTQSDLSRMENGEYKVGLDVLFRILQVFELPLSRFFDEIPAEVEAPKPRPDDDDQILDDLRQLSDESRREVREFIAFKKMQASHREKRLDRIESSELSREQEDD